MTVLALALIGVLNWLRSFTPPAAAAWASYLRWIKVQGALALIGSVPVVDCSFCRTARFRPAQG